MQGVLRFRPSSFAHMPPSYLMPAVQVVASEPVLVQVGGELNWISVIIIGALPIDSPCSEVIHEDLDPSSMYLLAKVARKRLHCQIVHLYHRRRE